MIASIAIASAVSRAPPRPPSSPSLPALSSGIGRASPSPHAQASHTAELHASLLLLDLAVSSHLASARSSAAGAASSFDALRPSLGLLKSHVQRIRGTYDYFGAR